VSERGDGPEAKRGRNRIGANRTRSLILKANRLFRP
jgi:hypothetical protein